MKSEEVIERLIDLKFPVGELKSMLADIRKPHEPDHLNVESFQAGAIYINVCINFNRYINQEIERQKG